MRRVTILGGLLALALLFPSAAIAEPGTLAAQGSGCKMIAKKRYLDPSLVLTWSGGCAGGFLDGQGTADIVSASGVIQNRLIGYFRQGVYLGETRHDDAIEVLSGDLYLLRLGSLDSGTEIWQPVKLNHSDHAVRACPRALFEMLALLPDTAAADDEAGQRALAIEAGALLFQRCGAYYQAALEIVPRDHATVLHDDWRGAEFNPLWAEMILTHPQGQQQAEVTQFTNFALERQEAAQLAAETEAWDADRDARRQDSAQRFLEFTRDNGVEYWASVNDIDENPYRYQGKMVAVPFALGRMADATTAIGEGFGWSWGRIFVAGLPRGFFDERTWAVVAGIVQEPETRDVRGGDWTLAVVYSQDALLCAHETCSELFAWMRGRDDLFEWGGPAEAFLDKLRADYAVD